MRRIIILSAIAILLLAGAILLLFHYRNGQSGAIVLYGNVDVRQVDLVFRVDGKVATLSVEEGDLVHTGDLLATLDRQPYTDEVRQTSASLVAAQATLANAQRLLARRQELVPEGGVEPRRPRECAGDL